MVFTSDIKLVWDAVPDGENDHYEIYRAPNLPIIGIVNEVSLLGYADTFVIEGLYARWFDTEGELEVTFSTGNDDDYTVVQAIERNGTTLISVDVKGHLNLVADGFIGTKYLNQLANTTKSTSYTDKEMPEGFYYYVVYSVTPTGQYSSSNVIVKNSPEDMTAPLYPPAHIVSEVAFNKESVSMYWDEPSERGVKGVAIYRTLNAYGLRLKPTLMDVTKIGIDVEGDWSDYLEEGDVLTWVGGPNNGLSRTIDYFSIFSPTPGTYRTTIIFTKALTSLSIEGYVITDQNDADYYLIDTTTSKKFSDSNIPIVNWFGRTTDVAYYLATYDSNFNLSPLSNVQGGFTIAGLKNVRTSVDYLSINVYWETPSATDDIEAVIVYIREKASNAVPIIAGMAGSDSRITIDNNNAWLIANSFQIEKGKTYEIIVATQRTYKDATILQKTLTDSATITLHGIGDPDEFNFDTTGYIGLIDCDSYNNHGLYENTTKTKVGTDIELTVKGSEYIILGYGNSGTNGIAIIAGEFQQYFRAGDIAEITATVLNNNKYTVLSAQNIESFTVIEFTTNIPDDTEVIGILEDGRPWTDTLDPTVFSFKNIYSQPQSLSVAVPDYTEDTILPTAPSNIQIIKDPDNDRAFITWNKSGIDDDILRYEVYVKDQTYLDSSGKHPWLLYGNTRDNNLTLNKVSSWIKEDTFFVQNMSSSTIAIFGHYAHLFEADITGNGNGERIELARNMITANNRMYTFYAVSELGTPDRTVFTIDSVITTPDVSGYIHTQRPIEIRVIAIDRAGNASEVYNDTETLQGEGYEEWRSWELEGQLYWGTFYNITKPPWTAVPTIKPDEYWGTNDIRIERETSLGNLFWSNGYIGDSTISGALAYFDYTANWSDFGQDIEFFDSYVLLRAEGNWNLFVVFDIDGPNKEIVIAGISWATYLNVGETIAITGASDATNNGLKTIVSITTGGGQTTFEVAEAMSSAGTFGTFSFPPHIFFSTEYYGGGKAYVESSEVITMQAGNTFTFKHHENYPTATNKVEYYVVWIRDKFGNMYPTNKWIYARVATVPVPP